MLQQDVAEEFVLATGQTQSVRTFVELAFAHVGRTIRWEGEGVDEKGIDADNGDVLIEIDPRYFRPTEVDLLLGDPSKAKEKMGWVHTTPFKQLVIEMVDADMKAVAEEKRGNSE